MEGILLISLVVLVLCFPLVSAVNITIVAGEPPEQSWWERNKENVYQALVAIGGLMVGFGLIWYYYNENK